MTGSLLKSGQAITQAGLHEKEKKRELLKV
jgi:hypothetical protein